jgi:hypothetical protein
LGVWDLGFRVKGLGSGVLDVGFWVPGSDVHIPGLGGLGVRVERFSRGSGSGFRVV